MPADTPDVYGLIVRLVKTTSTLRGLLSHGEVIAAPPVNAQYEQVVHDIMKLDHSITVWVATRERPSTERRADRDRRHHADRRHQPDRRDVSVDAVL